MSANGPVKVGDTVRFWFRKTLVTGRVIEDRGPLGVKGRQLYRVRYPVDPDLFFETELPDYELDVVYDQPSAD
jgi:hypothetical protein